MKIHLLRFGWGLGIHTVHTIGRVMVELVVRMPIFGGKGCSNVEFVGQREIRTELRWSSTVNMEKSKL